MILLGMMEQTEQEMSANIVLMHRALIVEFVVLFLEKCSFVRVLGIVKSIKIGTFSEL